MPNTIPSRAVRFNSTSTFVSDLAGSSGGSLVGFSPNGAITETTVQAALQQVAGFTSQSQLQRVLVTLNQTVVTVPFSYVPGTNTLFVFINGVLQSQGYTETNSTTVTFDTGLPGGEVAFLGLRASSVGTTTASNVSISSPNSVTTNVQALTSTAEGSGIDLVGNAIKRVSSFSALQSLVPSTATTTLQISVDSYYGDGGLGGGTFQWSSISTSTEDLGTIVCPNARTIVITSENIFTGNGSTVTFTGTLSHTTVRPKSVTFTAGSIIGLDDGAGNIYGTGITSGSINYRTGTWSVTYTTAPTNSLIATSSYTYASVSGRWIRRYSEVTVSMFGSRGDGVTDDTGSIRIAINSGKKFIKLSIDCIVSGTIQLMAGQVLDFDGGSLIALAGFSGANGVIYANSASNVRIFDSIIDASATSGLIGINLVDCTNSRISGGHLIKCNLFLQSSNNTVRLGYRISDIVIDMSSFLSTSLYVNGVYGASITNVEMFNGSEGIGIYTGSSNIKITGCESYGHSHDGFVIIQGTKIEYTTCVSHNNGQSGFTTQRQFSSTDVLDVSYTSCTSYGNSYDGFDLRGATSTSWGYPIRISASSCLSYSNFGTGFYLVLSEGSSLSGCIATQNALQGIFVNGSNQVTLTGCQSNSNSSSVASGTSRAGILIQDSANAHVIGCQSSNPLGPAQEYGVSFVGSSTTDCSLVGGSYTNNSVAFYNVDAASTVAVSSVPANIASGVWLNYLNSQTKVGDYSGFGIPTFTAPISSLFHRADSGAGELYISNGVGSWTSIIIP